MDDSGVGLNTEDGLSQFDLADLCLLYTSADLVDLVELDLGEDDLLLQTQGIVAAAVEGIGGDAAEVTNEGQSNVCLLYTSRCV